MELCDYSALEMVRLLRAGEVSAVDLLDSALSRIEAVDGRVGSLEPGEITTEDRMRVHSFITLTADRARARAQAVDKALAAGEEPGLLAGIPVSLRIFFVSREPLPRLPPASSLPLLPRIRRPLPCAWNRPAL